MSEILLSYPTAVLVLGMTAALSLFQLLLFDAMAIKLKHPPGYPIESSHKNLLFRLSRAHANTNETMGVMILLFLFAVLSAADPLWVNRLMLAYLVTRVLHMVCYYLAWSTARAVMFSLSIVSLLGLLVVGMLAYFS
ncbi:MAPEG family protein [Marinicella meishanensis]|uniref:MAPEG family protein n=1 Tax=Marinicella meishanensis TaxID=2873263 RepID=UPI001CBF13A9|nr:MAPEG family protein [Marinicella sp. NBU2979]